MISITLPPGNHPFGMQAGERRLMDNAMAADYLKNGADCDPQVEEFGWGPERLYGYLKSSLVGTEAQKVLIIRAGGIGDLLFITPALAKLMRDFPQHSFTLCAVKDFRPVVNHPALEALGWLDYPPVMAPKEPGGLGSNPKPEISLQMTVSDFDLVVALEEVVERDDERDAVAIFAEALGVPLEEHEKQPLLKIPSDVLAAAMERFPNLPEQRRIGIGLRASHDCRTWPFNHIQQLANLILQRDKKAVVFLFGRKHDFPGIDGVDGERLVWLPQYDLSLQETLAVLSLMDGYVGPDSGLLHAAGALNIPSVGIFGPYQWQQRVTVSPSIRGVNGHAPCAPCHHKARTMPFPPGMPCEQSRCCLALAQVAPDRVTQLLYRQMDAASKAGTAFGREPLPSVENLHVLSSFFGKVSHKGDVHPELAKAEEFHLGDWGGGAASIEEAKFLYALVLCLKPLVCLETGTETGWTAAHIGKALEENQRGHLVTLEMDAKLAALARENLNQWGLDGRVTVLEQNSFEYLEVQPKGGPVIDFALLDTHIELREQELHKLIPHLAPGAWVCVHDTSPEHPMRKGTELLKALREVGGFHVVHVPSPRGLTVMQRAVGQPVG